MSRSRLRFMFAAFCIILVGFPASAMAWDGTVPRNGDTFSLQLGNMTYRSNITENNNGSVWDLKLFDDKYVNLTAKGRGQIGFLYQLSWISDNYSAVQSIVLNMSLRMNSTNPCIFSWAYQSQITGVDTTFAISNTFGDTGWINWSIPLVGEGSPLFDNTTDAVAGGLICDYNGIFYIVMNFPSTYNASEHIELCINDAIAYCVVENVPYPPVPDPEIVTQIITEYFWFFVLAIAVICGIATALYLRRSWKSARLVDCVSEARSKRDVDACVSDDESLM